MHLVTLPRLNRALSTVITELTHFGFYDDKLSKIDVYLVPFGFAYGWQNYGSSGDICIPAISTSRLSQLFGYPVLGLCSILRHEFAHAIADTHRGLFHSKVFTNAFSDDHDSKKEKENPLYYYISDYAMHEYQRILCRGVHVLSET